MVHGIVREAVADLVHGSGCALVESHGHVPCLEFPPEGIVVGIVPVAAVDHIGAHERRSESERVYGLAHLFHRRLNVEWGYHGRSPCALRGRGAEVAHPAGIGPGYGVGQPRVHGVEGQGKEAAAGIEESHVYPLGIHGSHLGGGVPPVGIRVGVDPLEVLLLDDLLAHVARVCRMEMSLHQHLHVSQVAVEPLRRPVPELGVDVVLPQVARLDDVHVRIHHLEAVTGHVKPPCEDPGGAYAPPETRVYE